MNIRNICRGAFIAAALFSVVGISPAGAFAAVIPSTAYGKVDFYALGGNRMIDFSVRTMGGSCSVSGSVGVGCAGSGHLKYIDSGRNTYAVEVRHVSGQGNKVWFAGRVFAASSNEWIGNWLYAEVVDNGTPGGGKDLVSGTFTNEQTARFNVATHAPTGEGPYPISLGNVQVRN